MRHLYTLTILAAIFLLAGPQVVAQQPLILTFPETPCDGVALGSITLTRGRAYQGERLTYTFQSGASFELDTAALGPEPVEVGADVVIPIRFTPSRRGKNSDSLAVAIRFGTVVDTFRIRLTGVGLGPEILPNPSVMNFPRTSTGATSTLTSILTNVGDLPYEFTASSLSLSAPFRIVTPVPFTIVPGASAPLEIAFSPLVSDVFTASVPLFAGCSIQQYLALNGATDLIGTGAVLRLSKTGFNPVNQEESPCSVEQCTPVTISNAGNAPLLVESIAWADGASGFAITDAPALPFLVPANGQQSIDVCVVASGAGRMNDTLVVTSNTRSSIAFGMLIDRSGSMQYDLNCGAQTFQRMEVAIEEARRFIRQTLLHLPAVGIQDELTIMRYSSEQLSGTIFPLQPITSTSRVDAENTINMTTLRPDQGTYTGTALVKLLDSLAKSPLENRVVVLMTDGVASDTGAYPAAALAAAANARGIKIYTIRFALEDEAAREYLQTLAEGTDGLYFDGSDCASLQLAFASITDRVSRGNIMREPFALRLTSPFVVTSGDLAFDSTYYLSTSCRTVTLTNVGEGDAIIDSIALRDALGADTPEFFFGESVTFPLRILESDQTAVEICFRPNGLRQRGGTTAFTYNSCEPVIVGTKLSGVGWARAGMRIDDETIGLPGTIATMPVHLDSTLAAFEVGTVSFQVRWNKTMLDLRSVRPREAMGTGAVTLAGPVRFEGSEAVADLVATGDFRTPAGALAELEFLVLRGDSLASDVALTSLLFEDDNPKPLMKNAGMIAFDSTCFRSTKAIAVVAPVAKLVRVDASPVPARAGSPLAVTLRADGATTARIRVFGVGGELVVPPIERSVGTSDDQFVLAREGLAGGAYFVVVDEASGATHVRSMVVAE